jgi:hypothetical protein
MTVRILTGPAVEKSNFVMPSDAELRQLMRAVLTRYPVLDGARREGWTERDAYERERAVKFCFYALGHFTRIEGVEKKRQHAMSFWASEVEQWLHAADVWGVSDIGVSTFTICCVAHGDIAHTPLDEWPRNMVFGLQVGGGGKRGTDSWRKVLRGEFQKPEVPPKAVPESYPVPKVQFYGDGY